MKFTTGKKDVHPMGFAAAVLRKRLTERQIEILAYLATGGWNTVFGIGVYALLYRLFGRDAHYLLLAVPANILAITNAFLCYKFFVFRTHGHWLREYFRCYLVYGAGSLAGMALLYGFVHFAGMDPVLANICGTVLVVTGSYFGHKYFSFRRGNHE